MEHFCPSAFGRLPARRLLLSSPRPRPPPSQPPASSTLPRLSLHPAPPEGRSRPPRYAVCITATTVDPRCFCQLHPAPGDCVHMALPVLASSSRCGCCPALIPRGHCSCLLPRLVGFLIVPQQKNGDTFRVQVTMLHTGFFFS